MTGWLPHEAVIRLVAFACVFGFVAAWEVLGARRRPRLPRAARWPGIALIAVDTLVLRLLLPAAAIAVALHARSAGWGLLNRLNLPEPVAVVLGVVILDLAVYLQHMMFHAVPLQSGEDHLGRMEAGTGRHVRIPGSVDRLLRYAVVTPDMHRVHHSVDPGEHNRNFGFALPWWDRLFGTYRAQPAAGHDRMVIGLTGLQTEPVRTLGRMLVLPFVTVRSGPGTRPAVDGATSPAR